MSTPRWQKNTGILKRLLVWALILACWETAFRASGWTWVRGAEQSILGAQYEWKATTFPAPSHVIDAILGMLNIHTGFGEPLHPGWPRPIDNAAPTGIGRILNSDLVRATIISLTRLVVGFVVSITLGATLGLLMWRFDAIDQFIGPLFLGLQTLPSVCWVPLAILCFGINEQGILFVLVMGSFSAAALSLRDGLRNIPPLYPRAGLMLGASGWRLYVYILLPASLPALAGSLRTGFSFAWRSLMGAELIFPVEKYRGIGFLLETGRDFSDVAQVVAVMIIMVVIGMIADRWIFAVLQRRIQARFGLA
ncbi:MAG TPA: ABC transporter permease subunit [Tepidisphaeraceae bacterium]|nr:ABC transporter permease subunit [Tepidisphaeraceae bacterium]